MNAENRPRFSPSICHCLITGGFGGIERQVHSLVDTQCKELRVGVLFAMQGGVFKEKISAMDGVSFVVLGLRSGVDLRIAKLLIARRFISKFDIVHIHSINFIIFLAALFERKKIVYTFHGLTHLRRELSVIDRIKFSCLVFFANYFFHQITTVSEFLHREIVKRLRIRKELKVIPNITPSQPVSIKDNSIIRAEIGVSENELLVLTYSRLVSNKRIEYLLDVAKIFRQDGFYNINVIIIGDGPQKPILMEMSENYGIESMVSFLPFKDNIFDFINASDVCVFPYHKEAFGIVALESMSLGKPTFVMHDGGGLVEVVGPVSQEKYVMHDRNELASRIKEMYLDRKHLLEDMCELKKRAMEFNAIAVYKQYGIMYRSLFE